MWQWECTACGHISTGNTSKEAEAAFVEHAQEAHKPSTIVSVNTSKEHTDG